MGTGPLTRAARRVGRFSSNLIKRCFIRTRHGVITYCRAGDGFSLSCCFPLGVGVLVSLPGEADLVLLPIPTDAGHLGDVAAGGEQITLLRILP